MKKRLSVFMALIIFMGMSTLFPMKVYAAVQRIDRTGGRDDGTWLYPLAQSNYIFTDWAGCILGSCQLCGGNHASDDWGDSSHLYADFNGIGHNGVDLYATWGSPVMAAAGGTVRVAEYMGTRGLTVIIEHPITGTSKSYYSYYQHLSKANVSVGNQVTAGTVIAQSGNSGGNYDSHLHFGIVLAENNCNIKSLLFTLECSGFLTKADGYSKSGEILVNPSVRSVFPQGYPWVTPPLAYHSGSVTYTFDKSNVTIGAVADDPHEHNYVYQYFWAEHPHHNYYKCTTCGEGFADYSSSNYYASCAECVNSNFDTIVEGTYLLYNRSTDAALCLGNNEDYNCNDVHVYGYNRNNRGQLMSITSCSSDGKTYKIRPIDATRLVQMYGVTAAQGTNVCIYDDLENATQWWKFKNVGNGYAIFIGCDTNYALSSVNGGAVLNAYTGAANQIWELEPYTPPHEHNFELTGDLNEHPHYQYSICSCGEIFIYYNIQAYTRSCSECVKEWTPDKVPNFKGKATEASVKLTWDQPTYYYKEDYTFSGNYELDMWVNGDWTRVREFDNSEMSYTVHNLEPNTSYRFRIRACDWGKGDFSEITVNTDAPAIPSQTKVTIPVEIKRPNTGAPDTSNMAVAISGNGVSDTLFIGADGKANLGNIADGSYTFTFSANSCAQRTYAVSVSNGTVNGLDDVVKLHLYGDIDGDGKVNMKDVGKANAHAKNTAKLSGYDLSVSDINGDGKINMQDVGLMNAHAKNTKSLW